MAGKGLTSSGRAETILEGYLHKEGGGARTKWQSRWFSLRGDVLHYYAKKDDHNELGAINIRDCDDITKLGEHSGKQHCLTLVTTKGSNKKVYYLATETEPSLNEWFTALKSIFSRDTEVKLTKYATAEVFINQGIRINGDVNYQILTSLSMRLAPEKKHRDHLGWFCDREVALATVLNLFTRYGWSADKIYRSSALSPLDNGLHPVIRVIFSKSPDHVKGTIYGMTSLRKGSMDVETSENEPITMASLGPDLLEGTDDELISLMQEFDIPLSLLQVQAE